MNNAFIRVISAIIVLASIIWGYWWLTWALALVFLFIFPSYYEILFFGVMYDALYGLPLPQFWNFPYVFSLMSVVLFIISLFLRRFLLAYESTV